MPRLNILKSIESDILDLLIGSPLMPPTLLARPFEEGLEEAGRVTSNDNLLLRFLGIDIKTLTDSDDVISVDYVVNWEIQLINRDLRGHHATFQLIETILFLITNYDPIYSSKHCIPRQVDFQEMDDDSYRYWSIRFDMEVEPCETWYCDPWEAVPPEVACAEKTCDDLWLGLNEDAEYNICWRRYCRAGEEGYRYYNRCSQREGDEIDGIFFPDGDFSKEGRRYGPSGPKIPDKFNIDFALWRNTPPGDDPRLGVKTPDNKAAQIDIVTGQDIIKYQTSRRTCCF